MMLGNAFTLLALLVSPAAVAGYNEACEEAGGVDDWLGDVYCDIANNIEACNFDDGDCCECDCLDPDDTDDYKCGVNGFVCKNPASVCQETCSNGVAGVEGTNRDGSRACCELDCTSEVPWQYEFQCGGAGCAQLEGGPAGCCIGRINDEGDDCATTGTAPCFIETCEDDSECTGIDEICCPEKKICEVPPDPQNDPGACGDPHMTGFRGQKFDFTGKDGGWYAVLSVPPSMHLNMRVTSPVPSVPEITYITGVSVKATDDDGVDHTILVAVADPHSLDSRCPEGVSPCLSEGSLSVELDGEPALLAPGEAALGPGVAVSAVNLPGACRSFGFEKYWERKQAEYVASGRRLLAPSTYMEDVSEWILGDPTATNAAECAEYVAGATAAGGGGGGVDAGLFGLDSEHASFQILTPVGKIRLTHGRLHQVAVRDPTGSFDLPEHLTWQMNLAIDHHGIDPAVAGGILGETLVPTLDDEGEPIMQGLGSVRGTQEDYRVEGPLGTSFALDDHHG